jgi:hypothetical protein
LKSLSPTTAAEFCLPDHGQGLVAQEDILSEGLSPFICLGDQVAVKIEKGDVVEFVDLFSE